MATLSSEDIFIAVMGVTGSGKSTFVSMATGTPPPPEFAQLESCTLGVGIASFQHHSGKTVHLIDTPGFNDTHRTDGDILHELAFWLLKCYNHGIKLSGLVYLHSIREDRLQGSALRALNIFKNMVGPENYHGVVLATSMWDKLVNDEDYDHASERQRELVTNPNFWGEMIRRRSQVKALRAGRTSAEEIVNCIVSANKRLSLRIQVQMAEPENRHIHQTDAGKVLYETLYQEKDIMAQKLDALRKQLGTAINSHHTMKARELRRQMQEFSEGLSASDVLIKDFEKPTQELNETFEQRLERELQQVETMLALNNKRREDLEKELKSAESNSNSNSLFVHQPVRKYRSMVILKPQGNPVDSNVPSKQPVKARPDKDIEQKKKELELLKAQRELLYRKKEMSIQAQNLRVAQGSLLIGVVGTVLTGISVIACSIM